MATEYKLSYTASEIDRKLATVDETKSSLENDYYTSTEVDNKFTEVNGKFTEVNNNVETLETSLGEINTSLTTKADLVDGKIPVEQLPDDIGGGLTEVSWEDIKDKPFGEVGTKIEWDGSPTDEYVDATNTLGIMIYKVGEPISKEILIGSTVIISDNGNDTSIIIPENMIVDMTETGFLVMDTQNGGVYAAVTFDKDVFDLSMFAPGLKLQIPSAGLWLMPSGSRYISSITSSDYGTKQLDKKYIPDDIGGSVGVTSWNDLEDKPFGETGWSIEWDGVVSSDTPTCPVDGSGLTFYKVSDRIVSQSDIVGAVINILSDTVTITNDMIVPYESGSFAIIYNGTTPVLLGAAIPETLSLFGLTGTLTEAGLWFVKSNDNSFFLESLAKDVGIKQIDKKYIPNYFGEVGTKIEWDGNPTNEYIDDLVNILGVTAYKVGEPIAKEALVGYEITALLEGELTPIVITQEMLIDVGETGFLVMYGSTPIASVSLSAGDFDLSIFSPGLTMYASCEALWFMDYVNGNRTCSIKSPDYELKQIDKKFIPDDIVASVSLTFDEVPTEGSQNPVKSMGVHSAISALEGKITSTFCYKGTVDNYADLPTENNTVGDVWNITNADDANGINAGDNAAWNGTSWDILAGVIDLSDYYTKTEIDSIALNGIVNLANYYTKAEIDNMIGDCDTIIGHINTLIGGGNV